MLRIKRRLTYTYTYSNIYNHHDQTVTWTKGMVHEYPNGGTLDTGPRTRGWSMIEGKNPAHAHYPYNIKKKTQANMCYFDLLNVIMHDLLPGGDAEYVLS